MLKLFLLLKYLRRRRIIFLSIAAVAVSVSLLIVVASLFSGFIDGVERSAVELLGDVILAAPSGRPFEKFPALIETLEEADFIEAAAPTLRSPGLVRLARGNVRFVTIWGVEPQHQARVTGFGDALVRQGPLSSEPDFEVPGKEGATGGYVGIGVVAEVDPNTDEYDDAAILDEHIGQRVVVTTGIVDDGDAQTSIKRQMMPFYISDVVFTGVHDFDTGFVYVPIAELQRKLYPEVEGQVATAVSIRLKPGADLDLAAVKIRGLWQTFAAEELNWPSSLILDARLETARDMQRVYVAELRKQMDILLLIFGVVSFSVVVLVFCIFYMIVRLKRRDIAIVKSCGASGLSVAWVFLWFGITVGVIGAGVGAVLGYVITRNINAIERGINVVFGLKLWSSSVYLFDKIPDQVNWGWAVIFMSLAAAAAALGALTPAVIAALTKPVEVLRYE